MAAPEIRGIGTVAAGTGAVEPGLPAGTAVDDLLLMFAQTGPIANSLVVTGEGGWEIFEQVGLGGTVTLTILWRFAKASNPTKTNDTGDHQLCRILGIKVGTYRTVVVEGFKEPVIEAVETSEQVFPVVGVSIPNGQETSSPESLVIAATAGSAPDATTTTEFSGWANANLSAVTERIDNSTAEGAGGALGVATGIKVSPGEIGPTSATATTLASRASCALALQAKEESKPFEGGIQRFPLSHCYPVRTP